MRGLVLATAVAAVMAGAALVAGCGGGNGGGGMPPTPTPTPIPANPTWTNFGQHFFATYCVSCHTPGGQAAAQDFSQYSVVQANDATIRCGVAPLGQLPSGCSGNPPAAQFPIGSGPHPSDAERSAIVAWITGGAPQ